MLTTELKNKIDKLWETFWTGGLTNPLDVIEQITYLMFIHDLDEKDNIKRKENIMLNIPYKSIYDGEVSVGGRTIEGKKLKWSVFHDFSAQMMYNNMQEFVFPFIKDLHGNKQSTYTKYMSDAIFKVPTPQMLSKVVDQLDEIFEHSKKDINSDTRGDIYEHLLEKLKTAGVNGQFRTPRHIIKMMVELMQPAANELICEMKTPKLIQFNYSYSRKVA